MASKPAAPAAPAPDALEPDPDALEPDPDALEPDPAAAAGAASPATPSAPATSPAPPATGDVVEVIDFGDGAPAPAPTPPAAALPAPSPDSFQLSGWTRARLSIGLTDTGAAATDLGAVPFDRLTAQTQLHLRLRYARGRRFEAVVSGLLGAWFYEQDARPPDTFNLVNGATRTAYEAVLREAAIGVFFRRFDLRIGQQRVPWGRGDAFTPNDVINAYDLRDRLMTETEALRLPTLSIRGDLSLDPLVLSLVYAPFFQPDRFDTYGGNWALLQPGAPLAYRVLANRLSGSLNLDSSLYPGIQPLLQQTALPAADLSASAVGLRAALSLHRVDLDAFYHYGYDRSPYLQVSSAFTTSLSAVDLTTADTSTLTALLLGGVTSGAISATYVRRHHAGLSAAAPVGPLLLRSELAYDSQVVVPGSDLQGVLCPSAQAVLGLEYQRGDLGKAVIFEAQYQYLGAPDGTTLLLQRTHNAAVASLVRWTFLRDHLQLELRALVGLNPLSYLIRPQIAYLNRGLELRLGVILPGGEDQSPGDYYRRNLSIYTVARYSF